MNLLLCEAGEFDADGFVQLSGARAEHLRKILKAGPGTFVAAGIIGQGRGRGEILALSPGRATLKIELTDPPEEPYPIALAVGMVRPIQARRILKTAAAFGIARISFVPTALGEASYREASIWREYRSYLLEGAAQGGICIVPKVTLVDGLAEFLESSAAYAPRLLFDLPQPSAEEKTAAAAAKTAEEGKESLILIGSERGWTDGERKLIGKQSFETRSLSHRILTTETAVTAAITVILKERGLL